MRLILDSCLVRGKWTVNKSYLFRKCPCKRGFQNALLRFSDGPTLLVLQKKIVVVENCDFVSTRRCFFTSVSSKFHAPSLTADFRNRFLTLRDIICKYTACADSLTKGTRRLTSTPRVQRWIRPAASCSFWY